jgi:hypothetical protein
MNYGYGKERKCFQTTEELDDALVLEYGPRRRRWTWKLLHYEQQC